MHSHQVSHCLPPNAIEILEDRKPPGRFLPDSLVALPYSDNLAIGAGNREGADSTRSQIQKHMEGLGFRVHEVEAASTWATNLGFCIDGLSGKVSPTLRKSWEIKRAISQLRRRPKITGQQLEKFLGHCTFQLLGCRPLLSLFRSCYSFVQRNYLRTTRLWHSAVRELLMLDGTILHAYSCMRDDWSPNVHAVDSSLAGYGIMEGSFSTGLIGSIGQFNERWRFHKSFSQCKTARERALEHLDPFETVLPIDVPALVWNTARDFPEVPSHMLDLSFWKEVIAGRWKFSESIHVLEARVLLLAVKRLARSLNSRNARHLILSDNMSVTLAISKGRASDFALLSICRKIAAYSVACRFRIRVRWIPSELNIADAPSRRFMTPALLEHEARIQQFRRQKSWRLANRRKAPLPEFPEWPENGEAKTGGNRVQCAEATEKQSATELHRDLKRIQERKQFHTETSNSPRQQAIHTLQAPETGIDTAGLQENQRQQPPERRATATSPSCCGPVGFYSEGSSAKTDSACQISASHRSPGRPPDQPEESLAQQSWHDFPADSYCPPSCPTEIPSTSCSFSLVGERGQRAPSHHSSNRQGDGRIFRPPLFPGHRSGSRRADPRCREVLPAKGSGVSRLSHGAVRIPKVSSNACSHRGALGVGVRVSGNVAFLEMQGDSNIHLPDLQHVHETNRSFESESGGCGAAFSRPRSHTIGQDGVQCVPILAKFDNQDRGPGPLCLTKPCRCQSNSRSPATDEGKAPLRLPLHDFTPEYDEEPACCEPFAGVAERGHRPLPDASWRCVPRRIARAPDFSRDRREGGMASPKERPQIQKACEDAAPLAEFRQCSTAVLQPMPDQHPEHDRDHAASASPPCPTEKICLELFSGSGRLSRAVRAQGSIAEEWDHNFGDQFDLLRPKVQQKLVCLLKSRKVGFVWFGIPCTSVTRARRPGGGGPPPLRSNKYLWGFPDLKGANLEKVQQANKLFKFVFKIIRLLHRSKIPFVVENPLTSMLWKFPVVHSLLKTSETAVVDFCQFGTPWRKRTKLVGTLPGLESLSETCHGKVCSRTGLTHIILQGRDPTGVFFTKRAEPYPKPLCRAIATKIHAVLN